MLRKTLTTLSLLGLLLSVGAWGASCARLSYRSFGAVDYGGLWGGALHWSHNMGMNMPVAVTEFELENRGTTWTDLEAPAHPTGVGKPCKLKTRHGSELLAEYVVQPDGFAIFLIPTQAQWEWDAELQLPDEWLPNLSGIPYAVFEGGKMHQRQSFLGWRARLPMWIPCVLLLACYWTAALPRRRIRKRKKLGLCVKCGYNLKGLTEPRCPECNAPFEERLLKKDA